MPIRPRRQPKLAVEALSTRDLPSTTWSTETFSGASLPHDWSVRSGAVRPTLVASPSTDDRSLKLTGGSRVWEQSILPADSGAQAEIQLNGNDTVHVLVRGSKLETTRPTYYGASISRSGYVRLLSVVNGRTTVLASVRTARFAAGETLIPTLQANGTTLTLQLKRGDGQYLMPSGQWQTSPIDAMSIQNTAITGPGQVGVSRITPGATNLLVDDFAVLGSRPVSESFDATASSSLPAGWLAYGPAAPRVGSIPLSAGKGLTSIGPSSAAGLSGPDTELPANQRASVSIYGDSLIPGMVFVRGQGLSTNTPTYYAAQVVRGVDVRLVRVTNGVTQQLGRITSRTYLSQAWLNVSLAAQGYRLQVRVQRQDTGEWLDSWGEWQSTPTSCLDTIDSAISTTGRAGIGRIASFAGTISFDQFSVGPADDDLTAPELRSSVLRRSAPLRAQTVSGFARLVATTRDNVGVARVEFLVDGDLVSRRIAGPYHHDFDTRNLSNGRHTLTVRAWDAAGNSSEASTTFNVYNSAAFPRPNVPAHYDHIRYATLAYNGTTIGPAEEKLLRESVDLIVPNERYFTQLETVAPDTPKFFYSNISNLYEGLLTDWLSYADRTNTDRESAFYHVTQTTAFSGTSPSSKPVTWAWNVARSPLATATAWARLTTEARNATPGDIAFGASGQTVAIGYPDRFRELTLNLSRGAGGAWTGTWEYPSAVDAAGKPTAWKSLGLLSDSSRLLRTSGKIQFDPPADWRPAVIEGSNDRLYYVRFRNTAGSAGESPLATSILGRDYVNAHGGTSGTIPAFDSTVDANGDGYLNDAEFARRQAGKDARFEHESRLFYPSYGQMRFVTYPGGAGVADWAGEYHSKLLAAKPLADGIFMDNSGGRSPVGNISTVEHAETYAADYGAMMGAVNRAIAPKWVLANTAGGGNDADRVVRQVPGTVDEFVLRPLAHSWQQFLDTAADVARKQAISDPSGYLILDTLSTGGSPTDPRTRMAALAYYYLLGDPDTTFLMTWGGEEPASSWSRHWFNAIAHDVGQPQGEFTTFATGTDPANANRGYRVFAREYQDALVLYKPLSYTAGSGTGSLGYESATIHDLPRAYRPLHADGTLGAPITKISLRNGEGAVLIPA